ncbi:MAG: hypothetical protein H0T76_05855 [Nannocystis sp.]|nr:hypothetical protein [Nannocystis sp.]MBA3545985.1 hypothetical protein [Nannocystis sp.]
MASRMASAASKQRRPPAAGRNVLERLLVECVQTTRAVPSESGVRFHVHVPAEAEHSVCLVYHVDLQPDPLVKEGPRPDYLVLYGTKDRLIFTIVEMKGKGEQDLTHGVDQIAAFSRLLRDQLMEHVPAKLKYTVQGVLLMAHGAHAPLKKLGEMGRRGFVIAPVSYHHSAELFPYISRPLELEGSAYRHESNRDRPFSPLERMLAEGKLPTREDDAFRRERWAPGQPGVYVNYASPVTAKPRRARTSYAALAIDAKRADIGVCASGDELYDLLLTELEGGLGLSASRKFLRLLRVTAGEAPT